MKPFLLMLSVLVGLHSFAQNITTTVKTISVDIKQADSSSGKRTPKPPKKKHEANPMLIAFDETGQMIRFPNAVIYPNDRVVFGVQISGTYFASQVNTLLDKLDSLHAYFGVESSHQQFLWELFGGDSTAVDNFTTQLEDYDAFRQELGDSMYTPITYDTLSKPMQHASFITYMPILAYFKAVLYEQFRINVYSVSGLIKRNIVLRPAFGLKDKYGCYWWYSDTMTIKDLMGNNCNDCAQTLRYTLITKEPWNSTVVKWYNQQFDSCNRNPKDLAASLTYLQQHAQEFRSSIAKKFNNKEIVDSSYKIAFKQEELPQEYIAILKRLSCWMLPWLWYNHGYLTVTPYPGYSSSEATRIKNALQERNTELERKKKQKIFLDSCLARLKPDLQKFDSVRIILDTTYKIDTAILNLQRSIEQLNTAQKANDALKKQSLAISNRQAYFGYLPIYGRTGWWHRRGLFPNELWVQQQLSYSPSRNTINLVYRNSQLRKSVTEIPENEHALIVLHNVPKDAKIKVTQALSGYDDTEEFTKVFQSILKGIDTTGLLKLASAPGVLNAISFLRNIYNRQAITTGNEEIAKNNGMSLFRQSALSEATLKYIDASLENHPVSLTTTQITVTKIAAQTDTITGFVSQVYQAIDSVAPYKVTIALTIDSIKAKTYVFTGALRRIQFAAGFAVVRHPIDQTTIDTSGNGFKTSSASNNVNAVVGIKLYPARTYLRDGGIVPRYPLRRFSVMLAASIPKVLNNFYVGGGYDVVPGLTIAAGNNFFRQEFYKVQDARITGSAIRYKSAGLYYGVTVNPLIFAQFVKMFF